MGREFEAKVLISADEFIDLIRECGLTFSQKKSVFLLWVITSTFMLCPIIFMDLSRSVAALSHYIEILC